MRKLLVLALSLMMVFTMASCGGSGEAGESGGNDKSVKKEVKESKTYGILKDLSEDKGFSMDIDTTVEGMAVNMVMASKGEKYYIKITGEGLGSISIFDGESYYSLDTDTMLGSKTTESVGTEQNYESFYGVSEDEKPSETGEMEIEGKTYQYETFMTGEGEGTKFCFDGDRFAYMISVVGEDEMVMKVNSFEKKVNDSMFKVPSGYTITDL